MALLRKRVFILIWKGILPDFCDRGNIVSHEKCITFFLQLEMITERKSLTFLPQVDFETWRNHLKVRHFYPRLGNFIEWKSNVFFVTIVVLSVLDWTKFSLKYKHLFLLIYLFNINITICSTNRNFNNLEKILQLKKKMV